MAQINLCKNPLNSHDLERYNFNGPLIEFLQDIAPQGFGNPIRAFINEEELELQNLDKDVTEDDTVLILVMPATGAEIGTFLWQMVASMAVSFVVGQLFGPKPPLNPRFADTESDNPVYALSNPKNASRVGEALPVIYGEVVTTPDYASEPYYSYYTHEIKPTGADVVTFNTSYGFYWTTGVPSDLGVLAVNYSTKFLLSLFCVGSGRFNVKKTLAGDTEITSNPNITSRYYDYITHGQVNGKIEQHFKTITPTTPPMGKVIIPHFYENVITAISFGQGELIKQNDVIGPYPVSLNQNIKEVQIDVSFFRGLSWQTTRAASVDLNIKIRNNSNVLKKDITLSINSRPDYLTKPTSEVQNVTFLIPLETSEPVSLEITRISAEQADDEVSDIMITGVKGVVDVPNTVKQYGNVTLLATRIKSSEFTSTASSSRIRSQVQRINLPKGVDGTTNITTSNPADIIYDIWNNTEYGAGRTDDNTFDKALLTKLKNHWSTFTGGEDGFNAVFNQKTTVFEAMETTANFVASDLLMIGSELSLAYENKKEVRRQLFSMANIVQGSFKINYKWDRVGEPDGITIEYLSHELFEPSFVTWPATATDPRKVKLFGCTSESYALDYAKYLYKKQILDRKTISFSTELEGLIPRVGDRIGVSHELADWGISGNLIDYDSATRTFTLDKDLGYTLGSTCQIVLRTEFGTPYPDKTPMPATVIDSNKVKINFSFPFPVDGFHYAVAKTAQITTDFIVTTISSSDYKVDITASLYVAEKYIDTLPFMNTEVS